MAIESTITRAGWKDYLMLTKPRVILLHIITAAAAMFLAAKGWPSISILFFTLFGGGLVAGASNVFNCYFDRDIDKIMVRTQNRPLPAGKMNSFQALIFGIILGCAGILILSQMVSWITAILAVGAFAYYILVYTLWLKRRTYWSSIIGSGAGAFPPLIGWIAVTGQVGVAPFLLFIIIALWTPPHFWSLAIFRRRDYEHVGIGVIPDRYATSWIVIFSIILVLASISLQQIAFLGLFYLAAAASSGTVMIGLSVLLLIRKNSFNAQRLYCYSIIYLIFLFSAMLIDRLVLI